MRTPPYDQKTSAFGALLVGALLGLTPGARANEGTASVFVRGDTDQTTVISPHAGIQARMNGERTTANVGYTADIWTSPVSVPPPLDSPASSTSLKLNSTTGFHGSSSPNRPA